MDGLELDMRQSCADEEGHPVIRMVEAFQRRPTQAVIESRYVVRNLDDVLDWNAGRFLQFVNRL